MVKIVAWLGYSEERVWNSFFLQYLWEFCLGIKLAELYVKTPSLLNTLPCIQLVLICVVGIVLTGLTGWLGFPWRLYNDIPSLMGYTSLALIIYQTKIGAINNLFRNINKCSYEWYLIHVLAFQIVVCKLPKLAY